MMWCPQPCPRHGTCRCHYCQRLARFQTCQVPRCICCPVVACGIWIIAHLQLCCCGSAAVCVCVVTGGRGGPSRVVDFDPDLEAGRGSNWGELQLWMCSVYDVYTNTSTKCFQYYTQRGYHSCMVESRPSLVRLRP